jgi:putative FmdB family regulatory protein
MPTYRYRCGECGEEFEIWQSIKDEALRTHEGCDGELKKVLSPAGIVLKGAGFYKTDSRAARDRASKRSSGSPDKGADQSTSSTSGAGDGAKPSETKSSETKSSESKPTTGASKT